MPLSEMVANLREKNPGCLGYIGDDILPNYIGIFINQYQDPYEPTSIMESDTLPKFNIAPEKLPFQYQFSGAMLNFGGVRVFCRGSFHLLECVLRSSFLARLPDGKLKDCRRGCWWSS